MQEGFNVGTVYRADNESNPWRRQITELKLKVAHGSFFPYFVLGSKYFADVTPDIQFAIVDGIIGEMLAKRAIQVRLGEPEPQPDRPETLVPIIEFKPENAGWTQAEFDQLDNFSQREVVQDWLDGVYIEAEVEHNPIYRLVDELEAELGRPPYSLRPRRWPSHENASTVAERRRQYDAAILVGEECIVTSEQFGAITRTVWIPHFKTPYFLGLSTLEEMAKLVSLDALRQRMRRVLEC